MQVSVVLHTDSVVLSVTKYHILVSTSLRKVVCRDGSKISATIIIAIFFTNTIKVKKDSSSASQDISLLN